MNNPIITTWDAVDRFIRHAEADHNAIETYWDEDVIAPIWNDLARWAPFDVSFMKPQVIKDIAKLRIQNVLLKKIDAHQIEGDIQFILKNLPQQDDDAILIALFPFKDDAEFNKRQNGIQGIGVFGNIILCINPLAEQYEEWIPYVLAHEYHHSVWGSVWYGQKQAAKGNLLEAILTEGQADYFAKMLYPERTPKWITAYSPDEFEHYFLILQEHIYCTDRNEYNEFVFGNAQKQLPWCIGYSIGYEMINQYAKMTGKTPLELVNTSCDEIYEVFTEQIRKRGRI